MSTAHAELPSDSAFARRHGRLAIGAGLAVEVVTLGIIAIASGLGSNTVMVSGAGFLLGWIIVGFGIGEVLFANKLRVVTMLLALMIGIAGVAFNFWAMAQLGYKPTAASER